MRSLRIGILAIVCLVLLLTPKQAHARRQWFSGGYCSASYGYSAGYYAPGYYEVYTPPVVINVAAFIPYLAYQPIGVSTYQPVAAAPAYVPNAIAPVAQAIQTAPVQRTQADYCKEHTAGLEKRLAFMEQLMLNMTKGGGQQSEPIPQPQPMPQQAPQQQPPMPPAEGPNGQTGIPAGVPIAIAKCGKCHEKVECTKILTGQDGKTYQKGGGYAMLDLGKFLPPDDATTKKLTKKLLSGKMPPKDEPALTQQEMPQLMQLILDGK